MLWLSKKINCCHFNDATFRLPLAHSHCCLSKEFASKKRKKFLDGQWSEQTHGKRKVAQLKWKLLPSVDNQSIKSQIIFQTRAFASKHVEKCASYMQLNACQNLKSSIFTPSQCYLIKFDPKGVKLKMKIYSLNS